MQNEPAEASTPVESAPAAAAQTAAEPGNIALPALRGPRTFPSGYATYRINPVFIDEIADRPYEDIPEIAEEALRMCA